MKKLIIFFAITLSAVIAHSQTITFPSESLRYNSTISLNDYIQVDTFPIAQMDTVRYLRIGGKNYVNRNYKSGIWDALSLGILADGTDQSSRIAWVFSSYTFIKKLRFNQQYTNKYIVNSNVTAPSGIELSFEGTGMGGTGGLNGLNCIVSAAPDAQVFDTTFNAVNIKTTIGVFPLAWYGGYPGTTDKWKYFSMAQSATRTEQPVMVAKGSYTFMRLFTSTKSFVGETGAIIKYNPTTTPTTANNFWTVTAKDTRIENFTFDGSDKCVTLISIDDFVTGTKIYNDSLIQVDQIAALTTNSQAILLNAQNHNTEIMWCKFDSLNAKNNGVCRGIRGDGNSVDKGPKNLKIQYNNFWWIGNTGVGSSTLWDCDGVCLQFYIDSIGADISQNKFWDINKRAVKAQTHGVYVHHNWGISYRYAKTAAKSYAFVSCYGNDVRCEDNTLAGGSFETTIDIGSTIDSRPYTNIIVKGNKLYCSNEGASVNDGIRAFGLNNRHIQIIDNYIENVRFGIYLNDAGRDYIVRGNTVKNASDNSYSTISANAAPNNWHYNIVIDENKAWKGFAQAFAIGKCRGGSLSFNSTDSTTNLLLNSAAYVDSLLDFVMIGNFSTLGGASPNKGTTAQRVTLTNASSLYGMMYANTDSNFYQCWMGGAWIKVGGIVKTWDINDDAVTNAKLANMAAKTYKGRTTNSTGDPEDVSVATMRTDLGLADGIYTPTTADAVNASAISLDSVGYSRNANSVTVWGSGTLSTLNASSGTGSFTITLPVTTTFPGNSTYTNKYASGWCSLINAAGVFHGDVYPIGGTNKVTFSWVSNGVSVAVIRFHFSYRAY